MQKIEGVGVIFTQLFCYMPLCYISIVLFQFLTVNINEIIVSWIDLC